MENITRLSAENIRKSIKTDFIGKNIIILDEVDSTNSYAFDIIKNAISAKDPKVIPKTSEINGTIIVADTQTHGKGRFDRCWFSPQGGLWFSIILVPDLSLKELTNITLIAAASIIDVLNLDYNLSANIKWPNDIYSNGKKLAGILIETEKLDNDLYLVIGTGINVNNVMLKNGNSFLNNAISLYEILNKPVDINFLLCKIISSFERKYLYFSNTRDFSKVYESIEKLMIF